MPAPITLKIPLGATVSIIDPFSEEPARPQDARAALYEAAASSRGKVIPKGMAGLRYDVQHKSESDRMAFILAGGLELQKFEI